ncbi:hypothetical protein [Inquilinus limosus]|uniref:Lipoprotein n=1 Tax=Inquilinus limosus MP06 TaxID=1398085 RepID=A0A0A0D235_9PROT|nr:hypothetical protein [Inquilinus limosus]KGM31112.1 hypothetical protein P409_29095 [Inquilinus limosus MP06]
MRRRRVAAISPLIGAALVAACGGADRQVDRQLAGYVGATRAAIEAKFGRPLAEEPGAAGSRRLTFYGSSAVHVDGAYEQVEQRTPVDCSTKPRPPSCQKITVKDGKDHYQSNETEITHVNGDYIPAHLAVWWCSVVFTLNRSGTVTAYEFTPYSAGEKIDCSAVSWTVSRPKP